MNKVKVLGVKDNSVEKLEKYSKLLVFLMLTALCFSLKGQTQIDSLLSAYQAAAHDTLKIHTDIRIGQQLSRTNLDSSLFYLERALFLSRENLRSFPHLEGKALSVMAKTYRLYNDEKGLDVYQELIKHFQYDLDSASYYYDLLIRFSEDLGLLGLRTDAVSALASAYISANQDLKGITFLKRTAEIHMQRDSLKALIETEYQIGSAYQGISMFDSAIFYFESVIDRNLSAGKSHYLNQSYNAAGLCHYYIRNLDIAAEHILNAIAFSKATGDTTRIYAPYLNLGLVFQEQKEYEKAKNYMRSSLHQLIDQDFIRGIAVVYTNIGKVLVLEDSLDQAFQAFNNAWIYQQKLGWSPVDYYINISTIEKRRKNYLKYHEYAEEAVRTIPETYATKSKANVFKIFVDAKIFLADSVFKGNNTRQKKLFEQALPYAEKAWSLSEKVNSKNVMLSSADVLAAVNSRLNRHEEAFLYSQKGRALSDEMKDEARTEAIARMTTEFETEQVEDENALLRETQKLQVAQLKQQRYLIIGSLVVLLLIIGFGFFVQRSRTKLRSANLKVQKSLDEKELLLKEIHHRVKNNLQVISSLLDLQSRGIEDEGALATFMEGQNRVKAMSLIHQKLYQNENLAAIDFKEYAELLIVDLADIFNRKELVQVEVSAEGKTEFDIDTAVPLGLILNELISNAYKYAFEEVDGKISVAIQTLDTGEHQLTVSDTGGGLPEGFDFMKAKSLGLKLVRRLAKQLYGRVDYSYDHGSKFVIIFRDRLERKALNR
ncbi:MAG: sensor histidine kinase [Cyclobacteriaceae bacterium]